MALKSIMDTNTINTSGAPDNNSPTNNRSVGPVIGLIIILAIILIGGIYFWSSRMNSNTNKTPDNANSATQGEAPVSPEVILNQSSSDESSSIEADLNAFNESDIDGLGSDLDL